MNKIREICEARLRLLQWDQASSNRMWDKRADEFSRLSSKADQDGYMAFFQSCADLSGATVMDVGCGAGRYLKRLLDAGAKAEGLEPSGGMIARAQEYLGEFGYSNIQINQVAFQDYEVDHRVDYAFVANCPISSDYGSYLKLLNLATKGIFIGTWIERQDIYYEKVSRALGVEPVRRTSYDPFYLFNIFVADGYLPKFETSEKMVSEMIYPDDCIQRYGSWIYGNDYSETDIERIRGIMAKDMTPDGKIHQEFCGLRAMTYVDLTRRI